MFVLFLALTILSLIVLIVGFIWLLASRGQTTRRSGPDVGAEIMTGMGDETTTTRSRWSRSRSSSARGPR